MKMKLINVLWLGGVLLFSGCGQSQPSFNPNNKNIVFVEGRPYLVPANTKYTLKSIRNQSEIKEKQRYGVYCRKGDIVWGSYAFFNALAKNRAAKNSLLHEAAHSGHMGCANPLSSQQYQYVLQQRQINANRAAINAQVQANNHARNMQSITNLTSQIRSNSNQVNIDSANMMNQMRMNNQNKGVHIIGKMPGGGYWYK